MNTDTEKTKTENNTEFYRFKRPKKPVEESLVSIRDGRFHFNAHFARLAELKAKRAVLYSVNDAMRIIGFEFLDNTDDPDAYIIGGHAEKASAAHFHCRAGDLLSAKPWIKSVEQQKLPGWKRFRAKRDGRLWIIRLVPSFEFTIQRDQVRDISVHYRGIYRYRTDGGKIVYIGKGYIRGRALQPERATWKFAAIDYSIVESEELQNSSEHFWIEHFKAQNEGLLPCYNRQSGNGAQPCVAA
jgi:hypothetical protein